MNHPLFILLSASSFNYICKAASGSGWDYNDTDAWALLYAECGGDQQSPIDLIVDPSESCSEPLSLAWTSESSHFAVTNVGSTLVVVPFDISHAGGLSVAQLSVQHHTNDTNFRLSNPFYDTYESKVNQEYCLDSMHFHWSMNDEQGSEHTVNGVSYPLELHLVHYSCDYYVIGDALNAYASGEVAQYDDDFVLSVIGIMFEAGEANPILDQILSDSIIDGVQSYDPHGVNQEVIQLFYTEFDPVELLPDDKEFVAYKGSLTTPPCYETVRWNVMKDTMTVSEEQLQQFRLLLQADGTAGPNWRPVQDLATRTIYSCNDQIEDETVAKQETDVDEIVDSKSWDYVNTDWSEKYPECGGLQQSPINLELMDTDQCDAEGALELQWTSETVHFGVQNTGYSLQAIPFEVSTNEGSDISRLEVLHHSNDTAIRLVNSFYDTYESNVNEEYCFDSMHFHWGLTDEDGSEHAINGQYSPLEVHLVHFSCDYTLAGDAIDAYVNGDTAAYDDQHVLAVIGVLFDIGEANSALDKLLSDVVMDGIQYYDAQRKEQLLQLFYTEFDPADLLPSSREIVAYKGSLTTPPCLETVRWHVLKEKMTVSAEQMSKLRLIMSGSSAQNSDPMAPNWRPLMDVGERDVYTCEQHVSTQQVNKETVLAQTQDEDNGDDAADRLVSNPWFIVSLVLVLLLIVTIACGIYIYRTMKLTRSMRKTTEQIEESPVDYSRASETDGDAAELVGQTVTA